MLNIINSKPSAYRSMKLSQYGLSNPTKEKNDLRRWSQETWLNLNGLLLNPPQEIPCGKKYKNQTDPTVCRPKFRISSKTTAPLAFDLTPIQIKKAINEKKKGNRIQWSQFL